MDTKRRRNNVSWLPARLKLLQCALEKIIDPEVDSLRYYFLGDEWRGRVLHVGAKSSLDLEGTLIA